MITALIELATQALKLWNHEKKHELQDKLADARIRFFEEANKDRPDHNKMDTLRFEIFELTKTIVARMKDE